MSEIRDPIYGFIEPTDDELKIIDTPIFQRLRKIRQLACAYLVYPGALHTRFEHSIGVMHLTNVMLGLNKFSKRVSDEEKRLIKLAALLHDIGHGPFSHVSEEVLEQFQDTSTTKVEKIHENITFELIRSNQDIGNILNESDREKIIKILSGKDLDPPFIKQFISGPFDADKQDYLLRDSYYCGVKYGVYDYHRLINTLEIFQDSSYQTLAFAGDGVNALEQFILAKYYMTNSVYRHRIRLITDQMIIRGLSLAIEKKEDSLIESLYRYKSDEKYLDQYIQWSDDKLVQHILNLPNDKLSFQIFDKLSKRKLFKKVFSIEVDKEKISSHKRNTIKEITKKTHKSMRTRLEKLIAKEINVTNSDFVILNSYKLKSVKEMSKDGESESGLQIKKSETHCEEFNTESLIFNSINESLNKTFIEVYAPIDSPDNSTLDKWKNNIIRILNDN